uniref:Uncharacterized protein n=1 Tax=Panagrolaimus superbus TaxID=310955 RepID=A0A914YQP2_9BILA
MQIFQLDNSDHSNQLSQKVCTEIAAEKPIIVIDGAHCTGKTKLNICIFKEIFKNIFKCQTSNSDTPKCLALVSPCKTLKPQLEMFINVDYNLYQKLRILNLIDLNDSKKYGTFLNIIELVLNGENPEKADKEKLIAAKELLKTKFCPYHHEHDGGFERDVIFVSFII